MYAQMSRIVADEVSRILQPLRTLELERVEAARRRQKALDEFHAARRGQTYDLRSRATFEKQRQLDLNELTATVAQREIDLALSRLVDDDLADVKKRIEAT